MSSNTTTFKNDFGEVSPETTGVSIITNEEKQITQVIAINSRIEKATIDLAGGAASIVAAATFPSRPSVVTTVNDELFTTTKERPHTFAYMDVGRWGGPSGSNNRFNRQRSFGIVWGFYAVLCELMPKNSAFDTDDHLVTAFDGKPHDIPINALIRQIRSSNFSVQLLKWVISERGNPFGRWVMDWQSIHIILPDFHLPIVVAKPAPVPPPEQPADPLIVTSSTENGFRRVSTLFKDDGRDALGRFNYRAKSSVAGRKPGEAATEAIPDARGLFNYPNGTRALGPAGDIWFDRYLAGDIFGGAGSPAATELEFFLDRIVAAKVPGFEKHFVQVGDMYDFWIGLDRFYSQVEVADLIAPARRKSDVVLRNVSGMLAGVFIDEWSRLTGEALPTLITKLTALDTTPGMKTTWLWGNHDNYFGAHDAVMSDATRRPKPRLRDIHTTGVFIEHGHRGDSSNRDGEVSGHDVTNKVFLNPSLRGFDPNRRNHFVATAAMSYALKPDFAIYVMGHTHSPFLTLVNVVVSKELQIPVGP